MRLFKILCVGGLLCGIVLSAAMADDTKDEILTAFDFSDPGFSRYWHGWSPKEGVHVTHVELESGEWALDFSISRKDTHNTPMLELSPIVPVTEDTVLRFDVKAPIGGICHINLTDFDENAWYVLNFFLEANQWMTFRTHLSNARFKKEFTPGIQTHEGLVGHRLRSLQIATEGNPVQLKNFKIYNTKEPIVDSPTVPKLMDMAYTPRQYPSLQRGGVFPYGAFFTVKASDVVNGRYFGQDGMERFEHDLADVKRHYMNTVLNGSDEAYLDVGRRLDLVSMYHLYLVETALANWDLESLPREHPYFSLLKDYSKHEKLLAWYGKDEPLDPAAYLKNKLQMNLYGPEKPSSSCFHLPIITQALGSYMELTMLDLYGISPSVHDRKLTDVLINKHGALIGKSKKLSVGNRLWTVGQAFSLRRPPSSFLLRYPTPVETRFDVYNSIAAGADGLLFFIYNDTVPYLDGVVRREEFDETMVDAWGNSNPTYEEIACIGKKIVPVMPSLLGAQQVKPYASLPEKNLVTATIRNELGRYILLANSDLQQANPAEISAEPTPGEQVFDLITMKSLSENGGKVVVSLPPGDGAILMVATAADFQTISDEIQARRLQTEYEMADLEFRLMKRAKLNTGVCEVSLAELKAAIDEGTVTKAEKQLETVHREIDKQKKGHAAYSEMGATLDGIKKHFGAVNALLVQPEIIVQIDASVDSTWTELFATIKQNSVTYFALLRAWENGNFSRGDEARALLQKTERMHQHAVQLVTALELRTGKQ